MSMSKERTFMLRAIELAKKAEGKTYPNPMVGAVIVKNGNVIGDGYHKKAGKPHAEVLAIKKAGRQARGAEIYINLEPCAHRGRTPPCVDSLLRSGIKKAHVAMTDPNPLVNGKGLRLLRRNGIKVKLGTCRNEARRLNSSYIKSMEKKRCSQG